MHGTVSPLRAALAASILYPDAKPFHARPDPGEAFTAILQDGTTVRIEEEVYQGVSTFQSGLYPADYVEADFIGWLPDGPEPDSAPFYPSDYPVDPMAEELANDGALGRRDEIELFDGGRV